jgi:hypothetical protein
MLLSYFRLPQPAAARFRIYIPQQQDGPGEGGASAPSYIAISRAVQGTLLTAVVTLFRAAIVYKAITGVYVTILSARQT